MWLEAGSVYGSVSYWPVWRARQSARWPPPLPSGWAPGPGWGSLWGTAATYDSSLRAGRTTGGSHLESPPLPCGHRQQGYPDKNRLTMSIMLIGWLLKQKDHHFKGRPRGNSTHFLTALDKWKHTNRLITVPHASLWKSRMELWQCSQVETSLPQDWEGMQ